MKHYVGEKGTKLRVDVGQDITNATQVSLIVKKPDGNTTEWVGTVVDGHYIEYVVKEGDFNQAGRYILQARIVAVNGEWFGDRFVLVVYDKFD